MNSLIVVVIQNNASFNHKSSFLIDMKSPFDCREIARQIEIAFWLFENLHDVNAY